METTTLDIIMFQLQQLGLPFGFRSKAIWWQNYFISNLNHQYGKNTKSSGKPNCYEKRHIGQMY